MQQCFQVTRGKQPAQKVPTNRSPMRSECCMTWHDIADPASHRLDELAANYSLHQLHVEDCRQSARRIKVESGGQYLFIALKLLDLEQSNKLGVEDLVLFVGSDFLITVHSSPVDLLKPLRGLSMHDSASFAGKLIGLLDLRAQRWLRLEWREAVHENCKVEMLDALRKDSR